MADTASASLELPSMKALQTTEQMELLDVIDSLRAHGLGEITSLPQLIVCGDQSSGKSSVLEAISGIPFPRKENLCTRFATEVILRREPKDSNIVATIVPGTDRSFEDRLRLHQFRHELLTPADFPKLFETAMDEMGLSSVGNTFSKDVLRVEFRGPSQPQLTLVDLPGVIHSEKKPQTEDVRRVRGLVEGYLASPRSIILAVVSAKYDSANQVILDMAGKVDPKGRRTLGIITKPDKLGRNSKDEEEFITLARNETFSFDLGWHVVKNLDSATADLKQDSRDLEETLFFKDSNFNCLPSESVGIESLRTRLSKVLFDQIRFELPKLVKDIDSRVSSTKDELKNLGPGRPDLDHQRQFLIELSESFQSICKDAIRGDYDHPFFKGDVAGERRLCATVMNKHFEFAESLRSKGAKWIIGDKKIFAPSSRSRDEAIQEACKILKRSRGRELPGLPNPLLVGELFRDYSSPWANLAKMHIKAVWDVSKTFLGLVLESLVGPDVTERLLYLWIEPMMAQKLSAALAKLDELLEVHQEYPMTTNHLFIESRKKLQQNPSIKAVEERLKVEFSLPNQKLGTNDVARIISSLNPPMERDMDLIAAEEALDNMNAFYDVAMRLFMDNVPTLAIHGPIIRQLPKIFCPTVAYNMEDDMVTKIAEESAEKIRRRGDIKRRLKTLETGASICKQYAMRPISSLQTVIVDKELPKPRPISQTPLPNPESIWATKAGSTIPDAKPAATASLFPDLGGNDIFGNLLAAKAAPATSIFAPSSSTTKSSFELHVPKTTASTSRSPPRSPAPTTPRKTPTILGSFKFDEDISVGVPTTFGRRYIPVIISEVGAGGAINAMQNAAFDPLYRDYSPEELRLADYESGHTVFGPLWGP